jgi:hypothetical protein
LVLHLDKYEIISPKNNENKEQDTKEQATKGIRSLSNDYIEVEKI